MKLKIVSIKKRCYIFSLFYEYKVILIDLDTNIFYVDYMDYNGTLKNFKPTYQLKLEND